MDKNKIIFLGAVAFFIALMIWVIFGEHPGEREADTPDTGGLPGGQVYENNVFGFKATLPAGFTAANYENTRISPNRPIPGIRFSIPEAFLFGTNLSSDSYVGVEMLDDVECTPEDFLLYPSEPATVTLGDNTYMYAHETGAGAGNFYEDAVHVIKRDSRCYAVRYFIHSTNIGVYDPGTIKEYDSEALLSSFQDIATSIIFQ